MKSSAALFFERVNSGLSPDEWYKIHGKDSKEDISLMAGFLGECYAKGDVAYRTNPKAKKEIEEINKLIYNL